MRLEKLWDDHGVELQNLPSQVQREIEKEALEKWTAHVREEGTQRKSEIRSQAQSIRENFNEARKKALRETIEELDPILTLGNKKVFLVTLLH